MVIPLLSAVFGLLAIAVALLSGYLLFLTFAALVWRTPRIPAGPRTRRFAVLVPAMTKRR